MFKDLRDTFASQLLSNGIQLVYVQRQLGHSTPQVTARHYAKWCGGDEYEEPIRLRPNEIPADLLARLSDPTGDPGEDSLPITDPAHLNEFNGLPGSEGGWPLAGIPTICMVIRNAIP